MHPEQAFARRWRKHLLCVAIGTCLGVLGFAAVLSWVFKANFWAAASLGAVFGSPTFLLLPQQRVSIASLDPTTPGIVSCEKARERRFHRVFGSLFAILVALVLVATAYFGGRDGTMVAVVAGVVLGPLVVVLWRQSRRHRTAA